MLCPNVPLISNSVARFTPDYLYTMSKGRRTDRIRHKKNAVKRKESESVANPVNREVNNESPSARHQSPQKCDDVVADSQGTDEELSAEEEPDVDDLESKAAILFSLYERYSGEKCKLPEKTNCPLRDEYRRLFCIGTVVAKLKLLIASKVEAKKQLREIRTESLSQLKTLCIRLEDAIASESGVEKYLSFDDVAQRDALEAMAIRYEELSDDTFSADEDFMSLFDGYEDKKTRIDDDFNSSKSSSGPGANYTELCMQSMLTEVGLDYVNKVHKATKLKKAEAAEYRKLIAQQNSEMSALTAQENVVREELGELCYVVDRVLGVTNKENKKTSAKKSRST